VLGLWPTGGALRFDDLEGAPCRGIYRPEKNLQGRQRARRDRPRSTAVAPVGVVLWPLVRRGHMATEQIMRETEGSDHE
jgi:hypothetical protein